MILSLCKAHYGPSGLLTSRRRFLTHSAAMAGSVMLPTRWAVAEQQKLIDTHHHFYPPQYQKLWLDWEDARKIPHFAGQVAWSKSKAIEDMDRAGIRVGI